MYEKLKKLAEPFRDDEIEWRISNYRKGDNYAYAVPYVDNRAIQNRLDEVVGPFNWKNEFTAWHSVKDKSSQICTISIYDDTRKEWISKSDGAEDTDIEPVKGGLSDAMKRAAVHWSIGRYLYQADSVKISVNLSSSGKPFIPKSERLNLNAEHQKLVKSYFDKGRKQAVETPSKFYTVLDISINNNLSTVTMSGAGGEPFTAYFKGNMADVKKGSKLTDVQMQHKTKDNRKYVLLGSYKIAA